MTNNYFIKNIFSKFIEIQGDDSENFLQGLITNDQLIAESIRDQILLDLELAKGRSKMKKDAIDLDL